MERPRLVVMAGDPTQGLIKQHATNSPTGGEMNLSTLFGLAGQTADPLVTHHILKTNRRQHPELAEFASSNLCPAPMHCTRPAGTSGARDRRIFAAMRNGSLGFQATSNVVEREAFVSVNGHDMNRAGTEDLINVTGDMAIVQIVQNLLRINQFSPRDIVVLTPYSSDAQSIYTALTIRNITDVECTAPDQFMSAEASIVILHMVAAKTRQAILSTTTEVNPFGLMAKPNRMMVAMTRARDFNIVVGNSSATQDAIDQLVWVRKQKRFEPVRKHQCGMHKVGAFLSVPALVPEGVQPAHDADRIEGLQGGQARETTSRARDVEDTIENEQQDAALELLPDRLSNGYTEWIRKSYKPCNVWRALVMELQGASGNSEFYGSFQPYELRCKVFSSAMLSRLVINIDAVKGTNGDDIVVDADECASIQFKKFDGPHPHTLDVRQFTGHFGPIAV